MVLSTGQSFPRSCPHSIAAMPEKTIVNSSHEETQTKYQDKCGIWDIVCAYISRNVEGVLLTMKADSPLPSDDLQDQNTKAINV
jgi:hypothetical protein